MFGIFGAALVIERHHVHVFGGAALPIVVLNLVFAFTFGNISIGGHLGGLVGGILVMIGLWHWGRGRHGDLASVGVLLAVAALSVIVAYFKVRGLLKRTPLDGRPRLLSDDFRSAADGSARTVEATGERFVIGREKEADLALDDEGLTPARVPRAAPGRPRRTDRPQVDERHVRRRNRIDRPCSSPVVRRSRSARSP